MTIYQIVGWNEHFENNKSRERKKCSFACIPNHQDGSGYGLLMLEPDGESLYGAFHAVVLIASKQECGKQGRAGWESARAGYLTDTGLPDGCPLSARLLSVKCRFKEATIQRMLDVVSSNEIGWIVKIEKVPCECPSTAKPVSAKDPSGALEGNGIEGKRREEKGKEPPVLKMSEKISFEQELGRIGRELTGLGNLADHEKGSRRYKRIEQLSARQAELRGLLGVVA